MREEFLSSSKERADCHLPPKEHKTKDKAKYDSLAIHAPCPPVHDWPCTMKQNPSTAFIGNTIVLDIFPVKTCSFVTSTVTPAAPLAHCAPHSKYDMPFVEFSVHVVPISSTPQCSSPLYQDRPCIGLQKEFAWFSKVVDCVPIRRS